MEQRSDTRAPDARMTALGVGIRRHRARMTQTELATKVGLTQGSISSWEKGVVPLTCQQVALVEAALGLRTGTLFLEAGYVNLELLGANAAAAFAIGKLQAALNSLGEASGDGTGSLLHPVAPDHGAPTGG